MVSRVGQHCLNLRGALGAVIGQSASAHNVNSLSVSKICLYGRVLCRKYVSAVNFEVSLSYRHRAY